LAKKKASAEAPAPMILAITTSLTKPSTLEINVIALTINPDFTNFLLKRNSKEPGNTVVAIALADAYIERHEHRQAAELYDAQIKLNGNMPVLLNNASVVNITLGQTDKALEFAKSAYSKMPNNVAIMDTMAWAFTKANQPEKALNLFRNALAIESDNAEIKYHLAVNLIMLKRENEAIRYLKEAVESTQGFSEIEQAKQLLAKLLS
jgi:tetratricopeptide (TPR) repeat protein